MERIPVLLEALKGRPSRDAALYALFMLKNYFTRRVGVEVTAVEATNAILEANGIAILNGALRNFVHDYDLTRAVWSLFSLMMFPKNTAASRVRPAFLDSGGPSTMVEILRNADKEPSPSIPFIICSIFVWMVDEESLWPRLLTTCASPSAVGGIFRAMRRHRENLQFVTMSTILLFSMAETSGLRAEVLKALSSVDTLPLMVDLMKLYPGNFDITFCISRMLQSSLLEPTLRVKMQQVLPKTPDIADTLMTVAANHEEDQIIQRRVCAILEFLATNDEFRTRTEVGRLSRVVTRAMELHTEDRVLLVFGVLLLGRILQDQDDAISVMKELHITSLVGRAMRSHRSYFTLQAYGHCLKRMLAAVKNRKTLRFMYLSASRPLLSMVVFPPKTPIRLTRD